MKKNKFKRYSKDVSKIIQKSLKSGVQEYVSQDEENKVLKEAKSFLEKEFNASLDVVKAEESKENKAKQALPGKPAILVK